MCWLFQAIVPGPGPWTNDKVWALGRVRGLAGYAESFCLGLCVLACKLRRGLCSSPEADAGGSNMRPWITSHHGGQARHGELQSQTWSPASQSSVDPLPTLIVGLPWTPGRHVHSPPGPASRLPAAVLGEEVSRAQGRPHRQPQEVWACLPEHLR